MIFLQWGSWETDMTLPKWSIFTMGVYGKILCLLSDQAEISFLTTQKTLMHIIVVFSFKNKVIKKLLPKSLWQTYMKWTVDHKTIFYIKIIKQILNSFENIETESFCNPSMITYLLKCKNTLFLIWKWDNESCTFCI